MKKAQLKVERNAMSSGRISGSCVSLYLGENIVAIKLIVTERREWK
jgi:hypothetical protein